jgi:hypothetical protein
MEIIIMTTPAVNIRDHFRVCSRVLTSIFGHNVILGKEPPCQFYEAVTEC